MASYRDRLRMVEIACASDARFEASDLEAGSEPSYSIHTIERAPACKPLYFLIGADAFADIQTWYRWRDVVDAVTFIVVSRPGAEYQIPDGADVLRFEELDLPISSSEIRRRLKTGDLDLPLPGGVRAYIQEHGLYR